MISYKSISRYTITCSVSIVLFISALSLSSIMMVTASSNGSETEHASDNNQDPNTRNSLRRADETVTNAAGNHPPRADAGSNKVVKESDTVVLDGSKSVDPDGDKISYSWHLVSPRSAKINLLNDDSMKPEFVAPSLVGTANKLSIVIKLIVSDGEFQSSDIVRILVTPKKNDNNGNHKTNTVTVIDFGEPPPKDKFFASDICSSGTKAYSYLVQGVKWKTYPVTYGFDFSTSTVAERNAVSRAFTEYDLVGEPPGGFFSWVSYANAQIKITWKYIDGAYNQLGKTSFSYRTDTGAITSATITFDRADRFFISPTERCGAFGNQFDMQNIATHEVGHAINLGHVSDRLQSMYPTSFAGETLKRTLGFGDIAGLRNLY